MQVLTSLAFVPDPTTEGDALEAALCASLGRAREANLPYLHWRLAEILPSQILRRLAKLAEARSPASVVIGGQPQPFRTTSTLAFEDGEGCGSLARAFDSAGVKTVLGLRTGLVLADCDARLTLARDTDGYAAAPDNGPRDARFSLQIAVATEKQANLGPDLYLPDGDWRAQLRWRRGEAFGYAPSPRTWHGFEPRMIRGARTTLVVDYVPG